MALSLGTLEFSQAQLGDFILILWRVITVHLLWGLNPLLCGRHRLFHISQTPPNQQIMPHRSDRRGKRLFCGMSADTEDADGGGNCFLFQGKTSQATSVSRSICFWASLQYSCLCFFLRYTYFKHVHTRSSLWIIILEVSAVLPKTHCHLQQLRQQKVFGKTWLILKERVHSKLRIMLSSSRLSGDTKKRHKVSLV